MSFEERHIKEMNLTSKELKDWHKKNYSDNNVVFINKSAKGRTPKKLTSNIG